MTVALIFILFLSSSVAVIAGGVIGFLFAIFLILLLVYRMRKKDEGSYDLGERKIPSTAYQKAPTKEFYAWMSDYTRLDYLPCDIWQPFSLSSKTKAGIIKDRGGFYI